jgi:hypothetical protein
VGEKEIQSEWMDGCGGGNKTSCFSVVVVVAVIEIVIQVVA